jgi:hypothetical protein
VPHEPAAQGRAPLAAARALRVLGHVIDAREQLAVAEALGWSARLQRCVSFQASLLCCS